MGIHHSKKKRKKTPVNSSNTFNRKKLETFFQCYCETTCTNPPCQIIGFDGIEALSADMGIDLEHIGWIILAYHLDSKEMGIFTREEFMNLENFCIDSLKKLKHHFHHEFLQHLNHPDTFRDIYSFYFHYSLEKGNRYIDLDLAGQMLMVIYKGRDESPPHLESFRQFLLLQTQYTAMNYDQWAFFPDFSSSFPENFDDYDKNADWPVLFDDFVEWSLNR